RRWCPECWPTTISMRSACRRSSSAELTMYHILVHLLEPFTFLALCLVAATIWAWRRQRPRTRPLVATTVLTCSLIILSLPTTGFLGMRRLESAYPPNDAVPAPGDTLVVLSAGLILEDDAGKHARLDHGC